MCTVNTNLRMIIRLRKSEASVERVSVCNVIKNSAEHGIHCLPCSNNNDITHLIRKQLTVQTDVKVRCQHVVLTRY